MTRSEDGSAVVEFVVLAVLLVVPFAYAVLALFAVERAAFAVTSATREAARAYVTAPSGDQAAGRADAAARLVLEDHGLPPTTALTVRCDADPCLTPGARVRFGLTVVVPLPLVPTLGGQRPASVRVHAGHVAVVDALRESRP